MKSKFWNYVLYNYLRKVKSKAFIGFNIFLIVVGLIVSQLGSIVKFFNETFDYSETIVIVDKTNQIYSRFEQDFNNLLPDVILKQSTEAEETLKQKVTDGDISAYFMISYNNQHLLQATYVAKDFSNNSFYTIGEQVLSSYNKEMAMQSAGLTQEQMNLLTQNFSMEKISLDESAQTAEESMGNLAIAYISIILIFLFSYLYSVYAGQEIMEEKNLSCHGNYHHFNLSNETTLWKNCLQQFIRNHTINHLYNTFSNFYPIHVKKLTSGYHR